MASRVSGPVRIGRSEELDELAAAMVRARAGAPSLVVVGGEAGVDKSCSSPS